MVRTNDGWVPALVGKNVLFQWLWIKLELGLIFYQEQELEPDFYFFLVNLNLEPGFYLGEESKL